MKPSCNFLCISCEYKGIEFLESCHAEGHRVWLVTAAGLEDEPWPRHALEDIFFLPEIEHGQWPMPDLIAGTAWLLRHHRIDRIIALDDFDVEEAAELREYFRIPGMGQTTARYFRDKLAMRVKAAEAGLHIPAFSPLFHDADIEAFAKKHPAPWVVKPRSDASAKGIRKVHSEKELWQVLDELGDERHRYLVEQFKPGDVYHVDALSQEGKVVFATASKYLSPPFDVAHGGGIFRSALLPQHAPESKALLTFNQDVLRAFGMQFSASHTEFIRCHEDGQFYFLETSARVGGAHLADMIEAATGINMWREWARLESAVVRGEKYQLPPLRDHYAGIIVSLTRNEHPDTSEFDAPEVVWRLDKPWHIGLIVASPDRKRVLELLDDYARRIAARWAAHAESKEGK